MKDTDLDYISFGKGRATYEEARELAQKYCISSKQYVEEGMRVKIISDVKPEVDCYQPEITLEDAYMYVMNR